MSQALGLQPLEITLPKQKLQFFTRRQIYGREISVQNYVVSERLWKLLYAKKYNYNQFFIEIFYQNLRSLASNYSISFHKHFEIYGSETKFQCHRFGTFRNNHDIYRCYTNKTFIESYLYFPENRLILIFAFTL